MELISGGADCPEAPGAGHPLKLVQLLWSPDTKIGRSGTTMAHVVDAAIELADSDGLDALTMRRLPDCVGVGVMTLYGYVPGKPELIELMLDKVISQIYQGHPKPVQLPDWEAALRHIAQRNYQHALIHGWLTQVPASRPVLGPGYLVKYEDELAPFDGIGLDDAAMDQALTHVLAIALSAARWQHSMQRRRSESTFTDEQWWRTVGPALSTVLGATQLPISSRVGQTVGNAGDPPAFRTSAVDSVVTDLRERIRQ